MDLRMACGAATGTNLLNCDLPRERICQIEEAIALSGPFARWTARIFETEEGLLPKYYLLRVSKSCVMAEMSSLITTWITI